MTQCEEAICSKMFEIVFFGQLWTGLDPGVQTKRELWARLLTTVLGTQFSDDDELFIAHTLLVSSAKLIARAVVGLDLGASFIEHLQPLPARQLHLHPTQP